MLVLLALLLLLTVVGVRTSRGPVWVFSISWLICMLPMTLGLVEYGFFRDDDFFFFAALVMVVGAYLVGTVAQCLRSQIVSVCAPPTRDVLSQLELLRTLPAAKFCWWIAVAGIAALATDFALLEGAGLDDLATLRDTYISGDVSLLRQLASIATWACLYCYGFALFFRTRLNGMQFMRYLAPVAGYFLVALFSAGRQAALQIALITVFVFVVQHARGDRSASGRGGKVFVLLIIVAMIAYMGYVASARNNAMISGEKVEVLARLFDFKLSPWFESAAGWLGAGVKTTIVEGLVYFSSSVALFSVFLGVDFPESTYGAMSLPFIFRQLEWLTGISVLGALETKAILMSAAGVIGVGWTTGVSSYILDFGFAGALVVLAAQGYYSSFVWRRAAAGVGFNEAMIAVVMLMAAAYLPFLAATSDTNMLLLWLFCVLERFRQAHWPMLNVIRVARRDSEPDPER